MSIFRLSPSFDVAHIKRMLNHEIHSNLILLVNRISLAIQVISALVHIQPDLKDNVGRRDGWDLKAHVAGCHYQEELVR